MSKGFKDFISRGNVVDLAVGIVIGAAFGAIVKALVDGIILPIVSGIFGKPNFNEVGSFMLNGSLVMPGLFVTAVINFLMVSAGVYFLFVVPINQMRDLEILRKKAEIKAAIPEPPAADISLLTEIRDLLKAQQSAAGNTIPPEQF